MDALHLLRLRRLPGCRCFRRQGVASPVGVAAGTLDIFIRGEGPHEFAKLDLTGRQVVDLVA